MGEMPNRPDEHDHDDDLGGGTELHPDVVSAADLSLGAAGEETVEDIIGNALGRGLSYDDPDGIIYETATGPNPYESAQTFGESGVTVTTSQTQISNGSIGLRDAQGTWVDDWEDGDSNGWTVVSLSSGSFTAQQSTVLAGSWTGQLEVTGSDGGYVTSPSLGGVTTDAGFVHQVGTDVGTTGDSVDVVFKDDTGTRIGTVSFEHGSTDIIWDNGSETVLGSWTPGQSQSVVLKWDFGNDQVTPEINGVEQSTVGFENSVSNWDLIDWNNIANSTSDTVAAYLDNIAAATTGDALIEWDSGVPADIFEWDIATYTRSLDGETVDVFVAYDDGTGWTRTNGGSPVSRNYDLQADSNISPSDNVRIETELSRADTSNNPTLDSAYRSWLV